MRRRGVYLGLLISVLLLLVTCAALFALGSIRYGGPGELLLRARVAFASRRPHAQFVPTPFQTPRPVAGPLPTVVGTGDGTTAAWCTAAGCGVPGRPVADQPVPASTSGAPGAAPPGVTSTASDPGAPTALAPDAGPATQTTMPTLPALPAAQPAATKAAAAAPGPPHLPAASSIQLTGVTHMWQKWNNCGPATLAMTLSYFGSTLTQAEIAAVLEPNPDDKNISPDEIAAFARLQGLHALVRVDGDADRLRALLTNGVPVLIETWLELEPGDGMGHYRLLTGYDDASQLWTAYDSYVSVGVKADVPYAGIHLPYADVESLWTVFNRTYVVIYTDDLAPVVESILGEQMDAAMMWQRALEHAQAAVESWPQDAFAWFNLGSDQLALGQYEPATAAYDQARVLGLPWRMLWYQFGPFRAYNEMGRYAELIALADVTIATEGEIEEVYYYKGLGLAALGHPDEARQSWQRAIELNPNYTDAAAALAAAAGDQATGPP